MSTNYWIGAVIVLLLLTGGWYVFSQPKVAKGEVIKVGVIAPLTGNFAIFGERIRNAMELAKEDLGDDASNIEVIYEDACQPQQAISAVQKLIQVDDVSWFAGSFCLVGLVPAIPIIEDHGLFIFNTAANPDSALNHEGVFSTNKVIKADAEQLALFAREKLKAQTAASLYYVTPLGEDYGKYFKKYFEEAGGQVVLDQKVQLDQSDFRTELAKIKILNPDVIFVVHLGQPLGVFIKQARELGITSKILSHSEAEDPNVLVAAGAAAEGFYLSSSEPKDKTDEVLDFEKRYEEKYGSKSDVIAANAYDAFTLQVLAYRECGLNLSCMAKEFRSIKDYDGVSGNLTANADGTIEKPVLFKVVKDGAFVRYED